VKERMRAFSEPTKKVADAVPKKSTTERNYPPLIDIFADEKKRNNDTDMAEEKKEDDLDSYSIDKQVQKQIFTRQPPDSQQKVNVSSPSSSRGKGTVLASAFLAAIQNPSPTDKAAISPRNNYSFAPVNDGFGDDQGSVPDTVSVSILSSMGSQDDQNNTVSPTNYINKGSSSNNHGGTQLRRPSWLENRGKRLSVNGSKVGTVLPPPSQPFLPNSSLQPLRVGVSTSSSNNSDQPMQPTSTSAIIERLVDERVQARVAELERRMEEQIRIYMQQMEAKMASHLADKRDNPS
jgi:hypothetical protein